jgi:hypothetical protein
LRYWDLGDREVPGRSYLEKKLDEIERSELRAEPLSEVLSREEDDPDSLRTVWSTWGELKAVKVGAKVSLPADTEALRKRLALLGTAWMFLGSHQSNRGYLKGLTPQLFQEYASYLLGEFVMGLISQDSRGATVSAPSWDLLISYEHAIRVRAVLHVRKGITFVAALRMAWEDPLVKERHFSTPLALEATKWKKSLPLEAPPGSWGEPASKKAKFAEEKGKGKGSRKAKNKGKGKGTKTENKDGCKRKTPDGKSICFPFNTQGCTAASCQYMHVCGRCFKQGTPMSTCTCPH